MASVTGPVQTLPGHICDMPDGQMCDEHPHMKAIARIQGETDSFGAEYYDVCQVCLYEIKNYKQEPYPCDYCKKETTERHPIRDYEEGLYGPVYYVCSACVKKVNESAQQEQDFY